MNNISSSNSRTSPCVTHPTTHGNLALWGYSSSSVLSKQILCHANTSYYLCSAIPPVPLAVPASQGRCSCAIFTIPTLVYPVLSKLQGLGTPPVPFALDIYTRINTSAVTASWGCFWPIKEQSFHGSCIYVKVNFSKVQRCYLYLPVLPQLCVKTILRKQQYFYCYGDLLFSFIG